MQNQLRLGAALATAAIVGLLAAPAVAVPTTDPSSKTLENLQAAYNGESNAHAKYVAFAKRADEEGYGKLASLFRAAAEAEKVHAENHAVVIRRMGGQPRAEIAAPVVGTSRANLEAALAGESYERDTMYPDFLKQARVEKNKAALQSFTYAKTAEAEHAKLYAQALQNLDDWKTARTFYVCQVCGYTTTQLDFAKCISCFSGKDKYDAVS